MLCDTLAQRKKSACACADAFGKRGDAETSFAKHSRKPEKQAPSFPCYDRIEFNSQVAVLINEGSGWIGLTATGPLQNPWTRLPFQQLKHAKSAIKAYFKFGRWPGRKAPK